jgi:hypothetical protein
MGQWKTAARGVVSAGNTSTKTACTGGLYPRNNSRLKPRECFWRIYVPDINQILVSPFLPGIALNNEP